MRDSLPRRIVVVTVGRSDFSILRPLCEELSAAPDFDLTLWVGGAHFDPLGGMTVADIEASSLPIGARIVADSFGHTDAGTAVAMAQQLDGFGRAAAQAIADGVAPDLVMVLGDRFEAIAAGLAMIPFQIPVCHLSGGSITEGAIDDMFRHALTKLAALHVCDLPEFARRIHQMGEEPWRIATTGAPGLDGIRLRAAQPLAALADAFDMAGLRPGYVLSTLHAETTAPELTGPMAQAMVQALADSGRQVVYTYPNADPGAEDIVAAITDAAARHPGHFVVRNFGSLWYYTAMSHAGMIVGNSSSGIYEAASFGLPVVDIGDRQKNRFHGDNVLHVTRDRVAITHGIAAAAALRDNAAQMQNPYGDGRATQRVIAFLRTLDWDTLRKPKRFAPLDPTFEGQLMRLT